MYIVKIIMIIMVMMITTVIMIFMMMIHLHSQNCRLKFSLEFCCVAKLWVLSENTQEYHYHDQHDTIRYDMATIIW